ncbi:MAG: GAF domain-containing sensor histidine kinase [Desulfobacterales bacterium]|nr:GAF domain-containing sensor histidine kinase [Desulfobacterales bacterium]
MSQDNMNQEKWDLPEEIDEQKRVVFKELKERTRWFIKLRWFVPPSIAIGAVVAERIGFGLSLGTFFIVATFIFIYNTVFHFKSRTQVENIVKQREYIRNLTRWQFGLDFGAMFVLIHVTGGIASPLIFFFIFHVIFASILLPPRASYGFATMVVAGMIAITTAEHTGLLAHHPLALSGKSFNLIDLPAHVMIILGFFSASVYITAFFTSSIMTMLRKRISNLVDLSEAFKRLNRKLNALYAMTQAIGSIRKFDQVLKIVTAELGQVMGVVGISIKLLSEDGKELRFVAADGLVADVFKSKVVAVDKSPLNREIIEGKPFVTGHLTRREMFQFGEDLAAARIQSVLFVPLIVEEKVIGILGAYCKSPERFTPEEVDFFRQAAGLVAVAIENAQAYESIEKLIQERTKFMMRVAHNLRSPLAAVISILNVVRGGYQGELNADQSEYLRRVDRRVRTMLAMINELLVLARSREQRRKAEYKPVDMNLLAGRMERTFQEEARQKGLVFEMQVPEALPIIQGDGDMVEQVLENLVSNAVKYTPSGGKVRVEFSAAAEGSVKIQISDTGIGIPAAARVQLFSEFFRAENARAIDEHGTGLGLALVKEVVDQHGGRIIVESEEGLGSLFVVNFPGKNKG